MDKTIDPMGGLLYVVAWFLFALTHSLLARAAVQICLEKVLGRWYRFCYNLLAFVSIGIVMFAGRYWLDSSRFDLFDNHFAFVFSIIIQVLGAIVLLVAFMQYDIGRFTGVTQVMTGERLSTGANEPLNRQGLNRWVRHPLYTGAFLILWGGAISVFDIWTAILGSLYLVIGTCFEERKLLRIYGEEYLLYQKDVPKYFPGF